MDLCPLGSGSYIGGRPGRAPPLMEKVENIIITRDTKLPPPHGLGKSQIWRPLLWDFLDEPLIWSISEYNLKTRDSTKGNLL